MIRALRLIMAGCTLLLAGLASATPAPPSAPTTALARAHTHTVTAGPLGPLRYVALPLTHGAKAPLPVLVLLHGLGGSPEQWLAPEAAGPLLLAMHTAGTLPDCLVVIPEGRTGYWTNWVDGQHPWADWVTRHLLADVGRRYPVRGGPRWTAIAGASMGGYGALSLALQRPDLFGFAAGLSGTDLAIATRAQPHRKAYTQVFGEPIQQPALRKVNPWHLVRRGAGGKGQRFLLGWGTREPAKFSRGGERLARAMRARGLPVAVRKVKGKGHGWRSAWAPLQAWWLGALAKRWRAQLRASQRRR